jgi:acid phosphatase
VRASGEPAPPLTAPANGPSHIVVVVMENHEYDQVVGSPDAPFLDRMARVGVLLSREFAITHPSLPNYLALLGGSTFGITSDCTTCHVSGSNLVDQLEGSGRSWQAYMEGMPTPCFQGPMFGRYAKKHDPFLYFDDVRDRPGRCRNVVPFPRLASDLASDRLPSFAWITPDLCNDMHDCPVSAGDRFLSTWVPRIRPALGADGVLVVAFDEGTTDAGCCGRAAGGHVAAVIWGPGARTGVVLSSIADHYSLLRLVEDAWGLARLRDAACLCTPTVGGWRRP